MSGRPRPEKISSRGASGQKYSNMPAKDIRYDKGRYNKDYKVATSQNVRLTELAMKGLDVIMASFSLSNKWYVY